jgi:hypothetical protein
MSDLALWSATLMLLAAVALFVAAPLAEGLRTRRTNGAGLQRERAQLDHERALAVAALGELDFDHAMGKIDQADYVAIHAVLAARALTAMRGLGASHESIEPAVCQKCRIAVVGRFCVSCGAANPL